MYVRRPSRNASSRELMRHNAGWSSRHPNPGVVVLVVGCPSWSRMRVRGGAASASTIESGEPRRHTGALPLRTRPTRDLWAGWSHGGPVTESNETRPDGDTAGVRVVKGLNWSWFCPCRVHHNWDRCTTATQRIHRAASSRFRTARQSARLLLPPSRCVVMTPRCARCPRSDVNRHEVCARDLEEGLRFWKFLPRYSQARRSRLRNVAWRRCLELAGMASPIPCPRLAVAVGHARNISKIAW